MHLAQVAIARGPRTVLSYEIPAEFLERTQVGCRVLVPLGRSNRRMTAYVIERLIDAEPPDHPIKPISDVLDDAPLFDAAMLQLFKFISIF